MAENDNTRADFNEIAEQTAAFAEDAAEVAEDAAEEVAEVAEVAAETAVPEVAAKPTRRQKKKAKKQAKKDKKAAKKTAKKERKVRYKEEKIAAKQRKKAIKISKKNGTYRKEDFEEPDGRIKVGIIGCGAIASDYHFAAFAAEKLRADVVGLCDTKAERAVAAKKKYFPDATVYTDYHQLFEDESITLIDICTPNYQHADMAVDALLSGRNVICEAPDAVNSEEAERMYAAARSSGMRLTVIRNDRFNENAEYLRDLIAKGELGDIYDVKCSWVNRRGIPGRGGWFTTKELSGGGALIDQGAHILDLAMWMMGDPKPVSVSAMTYNCFAATKVPNTSRKGARRGDPDPNGIDDVEDMAVGAVTFENGAVLQFEFSWASNIYRERRSIDLRGTRAGAKWLPARDDIFYETKKGKQKTRSVQKQTFRNGHAAHIHNVLDVLLGEEEVLPVYDIDEGSRLMNLVDAIYRSADRDGAEVSVV